MGAMRSLREIFTALRASLNDEALLSLLNTRLIIRTGVDLRVIDPSQDSDPATLKKVADALAKLGFSVETLNVAPQRKADP